MGADWEHFIEQEKRKQLAAIIEEEHLKGAETEELMERAFADGYVTETGTSIAQILPAINPFLPESGEKKQTVINRLKDFLNRFTNLLSDDRAGLDSYRARRLEHVDDDVMATAEEISMISEESIGMAADPLLPPDPD